MEFVTAKLSIVELLNTFGHTTAASGAAPGKLAQPILIRGSLGGGEDATLHPQRTEALVINVRKLPANAVLQLDNVGFAILIGPCTVIGGAGRNVVIGYASAQTIILGAENDVLQGGRCGRLYWLQRR